MHKYEIVIFWSDQDDAFVAPHGCPVKNRGARR